MLLVLLLAAHAGCAGWKRHACECRDAGMQAWWLGVGSMARCRGAAGQDRSKWGQQDSSSVAQLGAVAGAAGSVADAGSSAVHCSMLP